MGLLHTNNNKSNNNNNHNNNIDKNVVCAVNLLSYVCLWLAVWGGIFVIDTT